MTDEKMYKSGEPMPETIQVTLEAGDLRNTVYGGFWKRLFAYGLDMVFVSSLTDILLNLTIYRIFGLVVEDLWWVEALRVLIVFAYFFFTSWALKGQTPGKFLLNLQVEDEEGGSPGLMTLMIREGFGKVIYYYIPWISIILVFTRKKQSLIDLLCGTVVIDKKKVLNYERIVKTSDQV